MNPQIRALHRLQTSDRKMVSLEKRLAAIPERLTELDQDLARLEAMLLAERSKLEESRDFKAAQEMQLRDEEDHIRASKARLGSVTTPRELNATQREIETTRRLAQARSEEVVKIATAISEAEARIESMRGALADLRVSAAAERERLQGEKHDLETALGRTKHKREELLAEVDRNLLRTYERIRRRSGGVGFVAARERRCTACKMTIPHSMYVSLRRGDEIQHCETCGRLLYWAGHFSGDDEPETAKPKSAPEPEPG
jgi:hypothetical protein